MKSKKGLTLIEVMVAISIAAILTIGIERLLEAALSSWGIALEEVSLSRLSEDTMQRIMEGDYQFSGLRDAVELIDVQENSVTFVPMWTEVFETLPKDGKFHLKKRIRPGAPPPISEIKFKGSSDFLVYPVTVKGGSGGSDQYVEFGFPLKAGAVVRFNYHPDTKFHPELAMRYEWDSKSGKISRFYNKTVTDFSLRDESVKITSVEFLYLDGSNQVVDIGGKKLSKANALIRISSVRINLELRGKQLTKRAISLVNLRALGKGGQGVILAKDLEIPLPDSKQIRLLQLINFTGVQEDQMIELKVTQFRSSQVWHLKLYLGAEGAIPVLRRLEVFYPRGELVFEGEDPVSLESGFDLLSLGTGGYYDYDDDEGVSDKVKFEGTQVNLSVVRSDPEGVTLIVRP
ncbi:MAG: prepilin-type N-terminal cleavage/methylation domain-containing protein [Candidatus Omnitrophica bacterium]|nr:prepilin-type N-terminal cleavage/methylation domain-containing protein [Candidatus Omnitrophota bacterium]